MGCFVLRPAAKTGQRILEGLKITVLGMLTNGNGNKENLMKKLATKTASTMAVTPR